MLVEVERNKLCKKAHTKFAKILYFCLENFLIEFFAIFDWKQNRIKLPNSPKIIRSQRCECYAWGRV